ncbi:ketopantoate reductase family protein [Acuticoccus sp. M5D2P5]|uniref:ketopantoate reductase family protein n=1 Tax=Acuticoccus kalidii TaxID=2910977 RepID=UPI001F3F35A0|nr:ketopantoate reductase family protein [Acuticoccus kalidii]MCF3935707.1 ketopantoate reductase family protein [Acuticoccus kalidii]
MLDRVLIWGAGAIGGTVGAVLARKGVDVTFVDVVPEHVAAIDASGLTVVGPVEAFTVAAPAVRPEALTGTWRHVFLCVKAQHTADAAERLKPFLAPDAYVVSLQNGLCEMELEARLGRQRVIGAFVNFGADYLEPGKVIFSGRGAFVLGELDGAMTPRLAALLETIQLFEPGAIATDRIFAYLWGKLGYASLLFAQALGDLGIADCLAREELLPLFRRLAGETMRVARAEGVAPLGFNGFDPAAFMPEASEADARRCVADMVAFNRPSAKTHSGIWRDLAIRKRRTEVDQLVAPIVTIGARHGIDCPTLARLVEMIHEVEEGDRLMSDDNLLVLADETAG